MSVFTFQYISPAITLSDFGSANVFNIRGIGLSKVDIEIPSWAARWAESWIAVSVRGTPSGELSALRRWPPWARSPAPSTGYFLFPMMSRVRW
jgi:hypothetical protein